MTAAWQVIVRIKDKDGTTVAEVHVPAGTVDPTLRVGQSPSLSEATTVIAKVPVPAGGSVEVAIDPTVDPTLRGCEEIKHTYTVVLYIDSASY
jgi:hypothetical protein